MLLLAIKAALTILLVLAAIYRLRRPLVGAEARSVFAFGQTSRAYAVLAAIVLIILIWARELLPGAAR
jgi:hypothetical protein